jgi:hypothetical protein
VRIAGALTIIAGVLVGAVLLLLPTQVTVLATSVSCGLPVETAARDAIVIGDNTDTALENECIENSRNRMILGIAAFMILTLGGVAMLYVSQSGSGRAAAQPSWPPPGWWTDGRGWYPPPGSGPPETPHQ